MAGGHVSPQSGYVTSLPPDRVRTLMPGTATPADASGGMCRGLQQPYGLPPVPRSAHFSRHLGHLSMPPGPQAASRQTATGIALHHGPAWYEPGYHSTRYDSSRGALDVRGGRACHEPRVQGPAVGMRDAFLGSRRESPGVRGGTSGRILQDIALPLGLPSEGYMDVIGHERYMAPRGGRDGELLRALHTPFLLPTAKLFDKDPYGTGVRSNDVQQESAARDLSRGQGLDRLPLPGPRGSNVFFDPYRFRDGSDAVRFGSSLAQYGRFGEALF